MGCHTAGPQIMTSASAAPWPHFSRPSTHARAEPEFRPPTTDPSYAHHEPRRMTPRTRAILPVHFAGRPCAMDELCALARAKNLKLIEDCAHAIETEYRGQPVGTFGDFGCFSFYVTKNMTTGEGGMVLAK